MSEVDPAFDASGHRARLRNRLIEGGEDALLDHELIEYLLMLTTPRRDMKPTARALLAEFGGFGPLLATEPEALLRAGVTEAQIAAIRIAQTSAVRLLKSATTDRPILGSWQALSDYLHAAMAHRATKSARVLHLNTKNVLIRDEMISEGSIDQAAIHVREVVRRALELHSASIILVHNHPSGDPQPSKQDIAITREIIAACRPLNIAVHDHVIVGSKGQASLRSMGLM
jgi:DNA repair protein RadC